MLAKPYLVSAYHLLQQQRPPANVVLTTWSKMVGDLTQPQSTSPYIAGEAQTAAIVLVLALPETTAVGAPQVLQSRKLLYQVLSTIVQRNPQLRQRTAAYKQFSEAASPAVEHATALQIVCRNCLRRIN